MKRMWIFMALVGVLFVVPNLDGLRATASVRLAVSACAIDDCDPLPWTTVETVLKRCAELCEFTFAELAQGYDAGWVTVETSAAGNGYFVRVLDLDGNLVIGLLIDNA